MAVDKFTFISPGIFISEVDESQNPVAPEVMGPVIIGRTRKGPGMRPVKVKSYSEFVDIFGDVHPGGAIDGDTWRSGAFSGPTYAGYAAKAWLAAGTAPATIVRLLGEDSTLNGATSTAGWATTKTAPTVDFKSNGGAFGLFVIDSGTVASHNTGTLAAVWYVDSGSMMVLQGDARTSSATPATSSAMALIKTVANDNNFHAKLFHDGALAYDFGRFNFDRNDPNYIRNVFNTTPSMVNSTITDTTSLSLAENRYWLGETYERSVADKTTSTSAQWGFIAPLMSGSTVGWHDRKSKWVNAQSNWFFSQDFGATGSYCAINKTTKLFKFHALDYGSWPNANLKIAIEDIRAGTTPTSPWGSFTVAVYPANAYDKTARSVALERFTRCNLDPTSKDYVAYRLGDKYLSWSDANKIHTEIGEFANKSKYIRVEMNPLVKDGINKASLPFGIHGPLRPKGFTYISISGSHLSDSAGSETSFVSSSGYFLDKTSSPTFGGKAASTFVTGAQSMPMSLARKSATITNPSHSSDDETYVTFISGTGTDNAYYDTPTPGALHVGDGIFLGGFTGSWEFPTTFQRSSSNDAGDGLGKDAFFGVQSTRLSTTSLHDPGYGEYNVGMPFDSSGPTRFESLGQKGAPENTEFGWTFTLDQISGSAAPYFHQSGSRRGGGSITAQNNSYKTVLTHINQFWAPMYGGHDGLNIKEAEPFRNTYIGETGATTLNNYGLNSLQRAIHTVADPEALECNLMIAPGITNTAVTDLLIETCQERADSLAIIDLEGDFTAETEGTESYTNRLGSVDTTVTNIQTRDLNNSYACAYYPWVQIKDAKTDRLLHVPPSVVALGTFASSEAVAELWFAPAGFNRGGLSGPGAGSAGIPVVGVVERLTSRKRDDLYENNINPIAKFPAEGIVIFGQKTLQQTSSALDRINVRRLMIYVKKEISRIAATILFDQNTSVTWGRFISQVEPFLADVRARFGLTDFKVILDETTTTPDLIDRNILYAKIFLKPARAIEYIAVDFIITRTGASFED